MKTEAESQVADLKTDKAQDSSPKKPERKKSDYHKRSDSTDKPQRKDRKFDKADHKKSESKDKKADNKPEKIGSLGALLAQAGLKKAN